MSCSKSTTIIVFIAAGILGGVAVYSHNAPAPDSYANNLSHDPRIALKELRRDIVPLAHSNGSAFATAVVVKALENGSIDSNDCHLLLHLLGHDAYRQTSDFTKIAAADPGNICINGFIHGAEAEIAASGDKVELWRFCSFEKERHISHGTCFHGAGHSYFEITKNVSKALSLCDTLSGGPESDLSGCYRGVFSEVGNEMSGSDTNTGFPTTPLEDHAQHIELMSPYALCNSLTFKYRDACYSQLAKLFYNGNDATPLIAVQNCIRGSPSSSARAICIQTISGLATRVMLDAGTLPLLLDFIRGIPNEYQRQALVYAKGSFRARWGSAQNAKWNDFCLQFDPASLQEMCIHI